MAHPRNEAEPQSRLSFSLAREKLQIAEAGDIQEDAVNQLRGVIQTELVACPVDCSDCKPVDWACLKILNPQRILDRWDIIFIGPQKQSLAD
ncbi:MAG TPA: hypothetical protein PLN42_00980 [Anaerolineae bacterium]|nr:hypothetical protein [Anaerolineae bacterium]